MKKIISLLIICLILISCFSITVSALNANFLDNQSPILMRAGGGGGFGGGFGFRSRSSDSSRLWYIDILVYFIVGFCSVAFYINLKKRSRRSKKLMKQFNQIDRAWEYNGVLSVVNDSFYAIQNAWTNMDMTPALQYMSDELYESFQAKLNSMALRKHRNVLEKIKLLKFFPVAVHDEFDSSGDYIWFYIKGKMVDYTINTDTQLKIIGSKSSYKFVEYWQFTRKENRWVLNKILQKDQARKILLGK